MKIRHLIAVMLLPLLVSTANAQAVFDHSPWNELLDRHVVVLNQGQATQVDYGAMLAERQLLGSYLASLSGVSVNDFALWPRAEQLAFLINAYNAWTVELILTRYPELDSIKDLGSIFRSPWSRKYIPLFGDTVSLDYIEHELIRGPLGYAEPRIHFAVNCASIGCPALRAQAYTGDSIEQQLEEATVLFLSDRSRNQLDGNTLRVSEIFDWYAEDFEQGWLGVNSVSEFLARYSAALELPEAVTQQLMDEDFRIRYMRYDWTLNRTPE